MFQGGLGPVRGPITSPRPISRPIIQGLQNHWARLHFIVLVQVSAQAGNKGLILFESDRPYCLGKSCLGENLPWALQRM